MRADARRHLVAGVLREIRQHLAARDPCPPGIGPAGGEPLFPAAAPRGAVYVVRDPRAVAVSSVHFMARSIDETIAAMDNPMEVFAGSTQRLSQHLRQPLLR